MATSCHVVESASSLRVYWHGQPQPIELVNPTVLAQDFSRDLAIVKLDYKVPWLPVTQGVPEMGDHFIMCGYPLGAEVPRIAEGVVSSRPEEVSLGYANLRLLVQALNANVNHGNSGGPVCTPEGEVVGVVAMKLAAWSYPAAEALLRALQVDISPERLTETAKAFMLFAERVDAGIGFSVPANLIPQLLKGARDVGFRGGVRESSTLPTIKVSRAGLTAFQQECNRIGVSPVGPFGCNKSCEIWPVTFGDGRTDPSDRTRIAHSLHDLLRGFFEFRPGGGRFYLLGEAICTYDKNQKAWGRVARILLTAPGT